MNQRRKNIKKSIEKSIIENIKAVNIKTMMKSVNIKEKRNYLRIIMIQSMIENMIIMIMKKEKENIGSQKDIDIVIVDQEVEVIIIIGI